MRIIVLLVAAAVLVGLIAPSVAAVTASAHGVDGLEVADSTRQAGIETSDVDDIDESETGNVDEGDDFDTGTESITREEATASDSQLTSNSESHSDSNAETPQDESELVDDDSEPDAPEDDGSETDTPEDDAEPTDDSQTNTPEDEAVVADDSERDTSEDESELVDDSEPDAPEDDDSETNTSEDESDSTDDSEPDAPEDDDSETNTSEDESDSTDDSEIDAPEDDDSEIDAPEDDDSETDAPEDEADSTEDSQTGAETNTTDENTTEEEADTAAGTGGESDQTTAPAGTGGNSDSSDTPDDSGGVPVGTGATTGVGVVAAGLVARRLLSAGTTGSVEVAVETVRRGRPPYRIAGQVARLIEEAIGRVREVVERGIWRVLAAAGYIKHASEEPLSHDTRAALYGHLQSEPGTYLSAFADQPGIDASRASIRYHLGILEREGLVTSEKRRGRRRYYPLGMSPDALSIALESDTKAAILEVLAAGDNELTVSELANQVNRDPSTVTYHLGQLEEDGLISRRRDGEVVRNGLLPGVAAMLRGESGAVRESVDT
jgi:DNA-binding transcriptional ArsR family regulator